MVLAIGLVVDDAIVVLENIQRRVDQGEPPLVAAVRGARQVTFAVIATTLVLVAVFVPLAFMEGNVGRLFTELAFTIAGAVCFSSLVALTLAPMLCSKLLRRVERQGRFSQWLDAVFQRLTQGYRRSLQGCIYKPGWVGAGLLVLFGGIALLLLYIPEELAPAEDRGAFLVIMNGPEGAGFDYSVRQMDKLEALMLPLAESGEAERVLARVPRSFGNSEDMNTGLGIVVMDHWDNRDRPTEAVMAELREKFAQVPGVQAFPVMRQGLGQGTQKPVQFVIGGSTYEEIARWRDVILDAAGKNPNLLGTDADYKETRPQLYVAIDRNRAADLGVNLETIGRTLETMLGSREVTTYIDRGEEYDVILQGQRLDREEPSDINNIYVRSERSDELIPLSNLVSLDEGAESGALNRFNRLRAVTIEANLAPGYTLGEALAFLEGVVQGELVGEGARVDYKGQSRELRDASSALYFTFGLALLMVFLVLAAQFESFIHPLVIILTVPLAIAGALIGLVLVSGTLNIYSQIGIVILIGLATKNGILIVEFANQLRDQGYLFKEALLEASATRLRPILMTGISTAMGALPLILTTGAGSASRMAIGIVVFSGVMVATLLTLYVVPTFYFVLGRYTRSPEAVAQELAQWEKTNQHEQPVIEN
jgi:multidrug efflux pump